MRQRLPRGRLLDGLCDRVLGGALLILLFPLLLAIAAAIIIEGLLDPATLGPVLRKETRISADRPFVLWKFRTSGTRGITRVGRRLLSWYLDELPQFFNIARGEMRFVGPRPVPLTMYRDLVERGFLAKSITPAGLTGLTQVNKGSGRPLEVLQRQYAALEESYADLYRHASTCRLLVTDLQIICRTVRVVLKGNGLDYEPGITTFSVFRSGGREDDELSLRRSRSTEDDG